MGELHVVFFPFMAQGHMIPTIDMAKLFDSRGVKTTIITTPANAPILTKSLQSTKNSGIHHIISIQLINFPSVEAGLPQGCERIDQLPSNDLVPNFFNALRMLRESLHRVLREARPDCLVADMFYPWATDEAAQFDIPRLVFHGTGFFPLCALEHLRLYKPQRTVSSDSEPFIIPNLPHEVKLTRTQLPPPFDREDDTENVISKLMVQVSESELTSYGVIANSFYDLESVYADHYREVLGRKTWHIGPVSLCNRAVEDKAQRGGESAIDEHECLKWLDSKKPNSVIYICFGSTANLTDSQLYELAMGIEASGQQFIWVVRKKKNGGDEEGKENWLPEGFEERTEGKGMIIRGWAPQVLILDHEAVGGFVTHCGWNSILEGVSAGVPMVTWPVFAEQFLNEKLLTQILRIGVGVGVRAQQWHSTTECEEKIKMEEIERAVKIVMVGEEAEEIRNRAKGFKDMARKTVEKGGSSYNNLSALIQELTSYHSYFLKESRKRQ